MSVVRALIFVAFGVVPPTAAAQNVTEIWKCVNEAGRAEYTNDKKSFGSRKCTLVSREVNVMKQQPPAQPANKGSSSAPSAPRESSAERNSTRLRQRQILERELGTEEQLLSRAQKELAEQENVRAGDERNYAKTLERLQPYRDNVETHQKNIEALRRELGNLSR